MATISNGESGLSVRNKLNEIIDKVEGNATIDTNLIFGDDNKAIFGDDSELQIYHDGSNSIITDQGTGNLKINASSFEVNNFNDTSNILDGNAAGAVKLYHAGSQKLTTTSTGVDITGTLTSDGLIFDQVSAGINTSSEGIKQPSAGALQLDARGDVLVNIDTNNNGSGTSYFTVSADGSYTNYKLRVNENGDISFYEDTGTTAKLTWAASDESLNFADDVKAIFGAGSDLQIYHDGSHSYISDQGTGQLRLLASQFQVMNAAGTESMVFGAQDNTATLYYDNAAKLATTSTGVDITGTLTSDGLTVNTTSAVTASFSRDGTDGDAVQIFNGAVGTTKSLGLGVDGTHGTINSQYGGVKIQPAGVTSAFFGTGGDISFYEDTGTTAKFFWDASAESLGIGTSSPDRQLVIHNSSSFAGLKLSEGTNNTDVRLTSSDGGLGIMGTFSAHDMLFYSNSTERMRIDSSGNVGIGTSSPNAPLHVQGSGTAEFSLWGGSLGRSKFNIQSVDDGTSTGRFQITTESTVPSSPELLTITNAGNVGIGTDSPNAKLEVAETDSVTYSSSAVQGDLIISRKNTDNTANEVVGLQFNVTGWSGSTTGVAGISAIQTSNASSADLAFQTRNDGTIAERMRIDSSGNVGIGVTPSAWGDSNRVALQVNSASIDSTGSSQMLLRSNNYYDGSDSVYVNTAAAAAYQQLSGVHTWFTAASGTAGDAISFSEAMRIDSSGNLLVGTTNVAPAGNNVEGVAIGAGGYIQASYDGYAPMSLNRQTSDGDIAIFKKDGATVGSIGTVNGDILIRTGNTGIRFVDGSEDIRPVSSTGSNLDATLDLGVSGASFKDLYLSGGVLNGTANSFNFITGGNASNGGANILLYGQSHASTPNTTIFRRNGSESMRITSSGHLLVGTTDSQLNNESTNTGVVIRADNQIQIARSGGITAYFNRLTSDGDIVQFRRDGTTVGSIGTQDGSIYTETAWSFKVDDINNETVTLTSGQNPTSGGMHMWLLTVVSGAGSMRGVARIYIYKDGANDITSSVIEDQDVGDMDFAVSDDGTTYSITATNNQTNNQTVKGFLQYIVDDDNY